MDKVTGLTTKLCYVTIAFRLVTFKRHPGYELISVSSIFLFQSYETQNTLWIVHSLLFGIRHPLPFCKVLMWDTHPHLSSRWTIISLFFCHTIFNIWISLIIMYQVTVDINPKYKGKKWTVNNWLFYLHHYISRLHKGFISHAHHAHVLPFIPSLSIPCQFSQGLMIQSQQCFFPLTLPLDWNLFLLSFLLLNFTTLD